jgi:hypothetical protein
MILEIRGHNLPGRRFECADGPYGNVHCGLQLGRAPADLVPGDAPSAAWSTEIRVIDGPDFRGPAVQGKKGERFVYLTWGDVGADGTFTMFRRAKLMLNDLPPTDRVVATVDLTDERGGPRCARLRPPALQFS